MPIIQTSQLNLDELSADTAHWVYNGLDCCVTAEIFSNLYPMTDSTCHKTYEFSKALQAPVLEMNLRGLLVNQNRKSRVVAEMRRKMGILEEQFNQIVMEGIGAPLTSWSSPTQLKTLLYDVMKLPVQKKRNANGIFAPSTDRDALEKLSMYFIAEPLCNHILALRDLQKSLGFLATPQDADGRLRTNFNIAGTDTGRFASSYTDFGTGTNLQNVTSSLRSVFVADPGMKFANLDLEQADSRNVGALCWNALLDEWSEKDAGAYLDLCESGDLHTAVLRRANRNLPWGEAGLTDRQVADQIAYRHLSHRDLAKKLGHGSNYLGQPATMARHSKLPVPIVKAFHESYFGAFPCIPAWHSHVRSSLINTAQLETPFGRRRFFFDRPTETSTLRAAVAYQPQSMTADEINTGILKLWWSNKVQLLIQVHDSILFQFPEELEDEIIPWALEELKTRLILKRGREFHVPTEAMTGWNWGYHSDENVDGLKKWKGSDTRVRQEKDFKLSLLGR